MAAAATAVMMVSRIFYPLQSWEFFDAYGFRIDPPSSVPQAVNTPRGPPRYSGPPLPADSSHDEHVARPVWPVATHKGKLTARRLVITFVPTTSR
jgi:hypothetical protein